MSHVVASLVIVLATAAPTVAVAQPASRQAPSNEPVVLKSGTTGQKIVARKFFARATNEKMGVGQRGLFCSGSELLLFTQEAAAYAMQNIGIIVRRELDQAGYPGVTDSVFDSAADADIEYELGATLIDMQLNVCGEKPEYKGSAWLNLEWELYSPRERRVVWRGTHAGSHNTGSGPHQRLPELYRAAIVAAARNLLADPGFVENASRRAQGQQIVEQPLLRIATRSTGSTTAQERMPQLQSAVVTVFSGAGQGSGFYFNAEGYLLTNQHVVGDAKFLKIKLANGRELLGEVLRSSAARDVALIKTEPVALATLELTPVEPAVGDEVLALGSPLGESLATSLTRGILSGSRQIKEQRWLQSDVRILPGSSGGPLLGKSGAVVGIAAAGVAGGLAGVNFFVPIQEALSSLRLDFKAP